MVAEIAFVRTVVAFVFEYVLLSVPEQTQESIQRFEQQAGLREAGYTPHKGLTTEETKYHRVAEAVHVRLVFHWLFLCGLYTTLTPLVVELLEYVALLKLLLLKAFS